MRKILTITVLAVLSITETSFGQKARFVRKTDPSFDTYTNSPPVQTQQWMREHFGRMIAYAPYFDARLSWFSEAWVYFDLYAIYLNSDQSRQHPDWILKDASGAPMYIPWGCGGGSCPQYAADPSNILFRRWWIDNAKSLIAKGYRGLWIDDANLQFRVGDRWGVEKPPIDPNTGAQMSYDAWRRYMAEFLEQIRKELPNVELVHNSIWFSGPDGVRDQDQYIRRQIAAADLINMEHGVNDSGLTGGTGDWSLHAHMAYIDRVHAAGKGVIIDDFANEPISREYALAAYFLIFAGKDMLANQRVTPDNWWNGYSVDPGTPLAHRYTWNNLLRRDYQNGMILLNEPGAPTRTVTLPRTYTRVDGSRVSSVTLNAKQAVVLIGDGDSTAPIISNVKSSSTTGSALVTWSTDEAAESVVEYGLTATYGSTAGTTSLVSNHSVSISGLAAGSTYNFRIRSRDVNGNLAVSGNYTLVTSSSTPQITTTLPVNSATAAAPVSATFSVPMNASTINALNFYVTRTGVATPIAATLSYDTASRTAVLKSTQLVAGSSYTATVKGGVNGPKNLSGVPLAADRIWSFTTATTNSTVLFLSDARASYAVNGWGPAEMNRSNGEQASGDGKVLTLNGATFSKGIGVHSSSDLRYSIPAGCSTFQAKVGVDDAIPVGRGSITFQVWTDGVKTFDSGIMRPETATKSVSTSVSGKKELRLIVTDAGDGQGSDHGDWAEAQFTCSGVTSQTTYLSDIAWKSAINGWGPVEKDRSNGEDGAGDGRAITLNGVVFSKGLGVHARSDIRFVLGGTCSSFQSSIGIDDETPTAGSAIFEVWGDGVKLFDSGLMNGTTATKAVTVNLTGRKELALIVTDGGDGTGSDHADWANARIICTQ